ncbi:MAG: DUF3108 domain-containing protein [Proteobacteria bacterium]|nr:DUF3108 domain-containing protein [Pseudomonadota bacterium]
MKTSRFIVSIACLIAFCLFASTSGLAEEIVITPYQASYKLYKSGMQVAKSSLSLEQSGRFWRWRLSSRPKGVYRLFSDKKPYSETTFSLLDSQYRIHHILLADEGDDERYESARFNWNSRQLDIQRKGKRRIENLPDQVYDFHTIHLLIARMMKDGTQQMKFNFYLKGKVLDAKLAWAGKTMLEINDLKIEVSVFHQTIDGQKTNSKYYYGPDSRLLPLKIENINSKGKTTVMILKQVAWL